MKTVIRYFFLFIFAVFAHACLYENEEELFGDSTNSICNTTNVSFSNTIRPILQNNCYSCHNNSNATSLGSGIRLENYNDVLIRANNGSLSGVINHDVGFPQMPQGAAKLDDCSINKIEAWINQGAKTIDNEKSTFHIVSDFPDSTLRAGY